MTARPASELEMTKAQSTLLDRTAESLSMAAGIASLYSELALFQRPPEEPSDFVAQAEAITHQELAATAERLLVAADLSVAVVGPAKLFVPILEAAGWPTPVYRDTDGRLVPPPS